MKTDLPQIVPGAFIGLDQAFGDGDSVRISLGATVSKIVSGAESL